MSAANVAELQDLLKQNGFDSGPTDGIFGPMTERALKAFQMASGALPTGEAGSDTFDVLRRSLGGSDKAVRERANGHVNVVIPETSPEAEIILKFALSQVGIEEVPPGSNRGPTVDKYTGRWAIPWCAAFCSYCINEAEWYPIGTSYTKYKTVVPFIYSTWKWREKLKQEARYYTYSDFASGIGRPPQAGDLFLMFYQGPSATDISHGHMGFVVSYNPERKTVKTVEGNTTNGVRTKERYISTFDGWGSPHPMPATKPAEPFVFHARLGYE